MRRWSRRVFLAATAASASLAAAGRGTRIRAPRREFKDGLTEREIIRLTDPSVLHHLPASHHRFIARNRGFLLLAAEHGDTRQLYRLDLRRQQLVQVTEGAGVHAYAAHLRRNDRGFYYLQRNDLLQADMSGGRRRTLYSCDSGWTLTGSMDISQGERYAALIETRDESVEPNVRRRFNREPLCRLRVVEISSQNRGRALIAAEERQRLTTPLFRPWRSQILYSREASTEPLRRPLHLVNLNGSDRTALRPVRGRERLSCPHWLADGARLRYVRFPQSDRWRADICSIEPEARKETVEAPCSGFGWLAANADGSAIVGASRRPSGPNLYLLFPGLRREITLAEHASSFRAYPFAGTDRMDSRAAMPAPALASDGSWTYFVTDREGRPAIYGMPVNDLVEASPEGLSG